MQELLQSDYAPFILAGALALGVFLLIYSFVSGAQQVVKESETVNADRQGILLYVTPILRRLALFVAPIRTKGLDDYREKLPKLMIKAGMEGFMVPNEYLAFHLLAGLASLIPMAWLVFILMGGTVMNFIVFSAPIFIFAMLYPYYYLKRRVAERHKQIFRALPTTLDLLTVSVEAGLDFMGGMKLCVEKGAEGPLRDELDRMMKQLQLGVQRVDGLREVAVRNGQPNLSSVCAALIQATKLGSSLGPILRIQASTLRERRSQMAEEMANKAPTKIIFPIVMFIFPSIFLLLLGPILIKTYYTF